MSEDLIKASEAARWIGVSLVTAKRMISDGRLVGEKIGSRWHVSVQSVDNYLNKNEGIVNDFNSESEQKGDQDLITTSEKGVLGSGQEPSEPSLESVNGSLPDVEQGAYVRARAKDGISFPVHSQNLNEFGHLFGDIQLDPERLFLRCLHFVDDQIWIYWRQGRVFRYTDTLEFDLQYSVPVIDLLSLGLYDVLNWLLNLLALKGEFEVDDYQEGLWRFELRREAANVSEDGDKLFTRCCYSYPFEFRRPYDDIMQEGGIFPLASPSASASLELSKGGTNGS